MARWGDRALTPVAQLNGPVSPYEWGTTTLPSAVRIPGTGFGHTENASIGKPWAGPEESVSGRNVVPPTNGALGLGGGDKMGTEPSVLCFLQGCARAASELDSQACTGLSSERWPSSR